MGGPVVENQMEDADPSTPETGKEHPQEYLKFDEALALKTPGQGFPGVHQEARKQLHRAFPLVAVAEVHGMAEASRRGFPTRLPGLDRRLLIRADNDVALPGKPVSPLVEVQNRDGLLQKTGVSGLLPAPVLPGLDLVGLQPTFDGGR